MARPPQPPKPPNQKSDPKVPQKCPDCGDPRNNHSFQGCMDCGCKLTHFEVGAKLRDGR